MSTTIARSAAVAAGTVLALALAGCGGDQGDSEQRLGPIDQLFEDMHGNWDPDQADADMMRMEEIIAECMAEEGFEYTPVDYSQGQRMLVDDDLDEEWGTLEFAKKYGYGATTNPWGDMEPEPMLPEDEWVDPNWEYVEAMSEPEQQAYNTALYGEQWNMEWTEEMEGMEYEWDWTTAGCSGRAQHEVYERGVDSEEDTTRFAALEAEMQTMWEATQNDPRVAKVITDWAACMAESGYPGLREVYDAENLIYERVNAVWENAYADMPPDAGEDAWRAVEESVQAEMAAITEDEITTAVADFTCRERVRYDRVFADVNIDHQQRFYDAHKDELIAWAESISRG